MLGYIRRRNKSPATCDPTLPSCPNCLKSRPPAAAWRQRDRAPDRPASCVRPAPALAGSRRPRKLVSRAVPSTASTAAANTCCSASATGRLLVHLGMTGSLRVHARRARASSRTTMSTSCSTTIRVLRYHDPRRFGAMLWIAGSALAHPLLRDLGPEPFDPAFNADYFWRATRSRSAAIKLALMDSHLVVGVRQHLRKRIAVSAPESGRHPCEQGLAATACTAGRRGPGSADRGHRKGRQHVARLRGRPRGAGLFPARLLRLRSRRRTVPGLRNRHPASDDWARGPPSTARAASDSAVRDSRASAAQLAGQRGPCRDCSPLRSPPVVPR